MQPFYRAIEERRMSNVDFSQIEPRLSGGTIEALKALGFSKMTPVQAATIPLFLTNKVKITEQNRITEHDRIE